MKTEAKNKKKQKKIIAKKVKKSKLGFIPMISIAVILAVISIKIFRNMDSIKKNDGHIEGLKQEYNHKRISNEALQQKVDADIDDEYIRERAREKGYRDLDEDMYYLNEGD
jgi:cell division protein FtsB